MQNSIIKNISQGSYILLCSYVGMAWGVAFGVLAFVGSFLSDNIASILPDDIVAGVPTSVVLLVFSPVAFDLFGVLMGWLSYHVFVFLVHATDGMKINGEIVVVDEPEKAMFPVHRRR